MRINARLDDSYEEKFLQIQKSKNKDRTAILKEALDKYFIEELNQEEQNAWRNNQKILEMVGGIASGPKDLSVNYKEYFYRGLKEKYDID
jgi:hypothetical protein